MVVVDCTGVGIAYDARVIDGTVAVNGTVVVDETAGGVVNDTDVANVAIVFYDASNC